MMYILVLLNILTYNGKIVNNFDLLHQQCLAFQARGLARLLSRYFDRIMLPKGGIYYSQFSLLCTLAANKSASITRLAGFLHLDRSTFSRNLRPLIKNEIIKLVDSDDKRIKNIVLTTKGEEILTESLAAWSIASTSLIEHLNKETYLNYNKMLKDICLKCMVLV